MSAASRARAQALAVAIGLLCAGWLFLAPKAEANTPILSFAAIPSTTQAGGHPDVATSFALANRLVQRSQSACNCEDAKDAAVHLPTGLIGNPSATPKCSIADFSADDCPIDSQIGAAEVMVGPVSGSSGITFVSAVYNLIPPPEVAGLLGLKLAFFAAPQFTILGSRTDSDYGLDATASSIFHASGLPLMNYRQELWGVPADPSHDPLRIDPAAGAFGESSIFEGKLCDGENASSTDDPATIVQICGGFYAGTDSNSPLTPFLQNPTVCEEPLETSLDVLSYDGGTDHAGMAWPQATGCNQLSFNPSLYAQPTTTQTDSPTGIDVNLTIPQQLSPTVPSPSELRSATVTLPPGFSINTNAADGKTSCSDAQANFGSRRAAECPEYAKVGSLEILSSALPGPLPGFVYLGDPLPGERYRVFLVADGFATHLKLPGTLTPDPQTGQLTASFLNLPQTPLTAFNMHFFGSERGALATPTQCGTYAVESTFVPWNSRLDPQTSSQFFTLDRGPGGAPCPNGPRSFAPSFDAASTGSTAGARTPFTLEFTRPDGDQNLAVLTATGPPGFTASLRGVRYCPEAAIAKLGDSHYSGVAEIAAPSCPAVSLIGSATIGAGAGSRPIHVPGRVYLAGPYKGAPVSIVVVVPAVSGPYDLGNVAVRAAVEVDPLTAQVSATSDPLPQILEGIPLRLRSIRVSLDRPDFAINPTNCDPFAVSATAFGNEGAVAPRSSHYQVGNCASLPYAPKISVNLTGGLLRLGHPAIHAVLEAGAGEANTRRLSVMLPEGQLLDNSHIGTICRRVDFAVEACPAASRIGTAEVTTPLLDQPLKGPIYLRASNNDLPDLAFDLGGQFEIDAIGRVDSVNARLRTTFETVPDVPFSRIEVDLVGGRRGLVVNSESLCGGLQRPTVKMTGQNGVSLMRRPKLRKDCKAAFARKRGSKDRGAK